MRKGFLYLFTFAVIILSLASCTATKYVPDGSYLLDEVKIHTDQKNVRPSSLRMYVRQNPNAKWFSLIKRSFMFTTFQDETLLNGEISF